MKNIPELFGSMVFNDDVMRERLPADVYQSLSTTIERGTALDPSIADCVAGAMKDWAIEKGATHYTHWFLPLTGVTAEKHDAFISPTGKGKVVMEMSGKELIHGEADASSFPSGGLRATFEARGYTTWDPASYAFVKDGSLYIPTAFCSWGGDALDTKTPLLRSMEEISRQSLRILRLFGDYETTRVAPTVGAEQEYFLISRTLRNQRKDLLFTGRTLFGAPAPKGQEMDDHYYGPLRAQVIDFMKELDEALWVLGIDAKTKHNEAAPAQHELAPVYATSNMAVDHNLLTMEEMKRLAAHHDLVCLLHEKPFAGVNGSGKHNNWSLSTDTGKNLLDHGKTPAENRQFLLILAAILKAVDDYQDLMRLSVASAGNDHRLGGGEAPPAIVSIFVGDELHDVIRAIIEGTTYAAHDAGTMNLGIDALPSFRRDTTDRNRTSPFAFTGNKFEFRMPGSAQNIAMPNIILNTAVAHVFAQFADRLESAENFDTELAALLRETFTAHERILFNGNGYSDAWKQEAARRGLLNLATSPEAFDCFDAEKNLALFTERGIMSEAEVRSRKEILFENYAKVINIEALTMIEMAERELLPGVENYVAKLAEVAVNKRTLGYIPTKVEDRQLIALTNGMERAYDALQALKDADAAAIAHTGNAKVLAQAYCNEVVPAMATLRKEVDALETMTSAEYWPVPTYADLMFRQKGKI
ncbi:MAG: glutamine synthetase III [Oscillospiraceae bacterium]|nr:glutamine synthetase III [Oscillospiraceae bacterium]